MSGPRHKQHEQLLTAELQNLARHITSRIPDGWGFALAISETGEARPDGNSVLYVSSLDRTDGIDLLVGALEGLKAGEAALPSRLDLITDPDKPT